MTTRVFAPLPFLLSLATLATLASPSPLKQWNELPPLPSAVFGHVSFSQETGSPFGPRVFVHGGLLDESDGVGGLRISSTTLELRLLESRSTMVWREVARSTSPGLFGHSAVVVNDSFALTIGGLNTLKPGDGTSDLMPQSTVYKYDFAAAAWTASFPGLSGRGPGVATPVAFSTCALFHSASVVACIGGVSVYSTSPHVSVKNDGMVSFVFDVHGGGNSQLIAPSIPARYGAALAPVNQTHALLYGGGGKNYLTAHRDMAYMLEVMVSPFTDITLAGEYDLSGTPRPNGTVLSAYAASDLGAGPCRAAGAGPCHLVLFEGTVALAGDRLNPPAVELPGGVWTLPADDPARGFARLNASAEHGAPRWGATAVLAPNDQFLVAGGAGNVTIGNHLWPGAGASNDWLNATSSLDVSLFVSPSQCEVACEPSPEVAGVAACAVTARAFDGQVTGSARDVPLFAAAVFLPGATLPEAAAVSFNASDRRFELSYATGDRSGPANVTVEYAGVPLPRASPPPMLRAAPPVAANSRLECPARAPVESNLTCSVLLRDEYGNPSGGSSVSSSVTVAVSASLCNTSTTAAGVTWAGRPGQYAARSVPFSVGYQSALAKLGGVALGDGLPATTFVFATENCPTGETFPPNCTGSCRCVCAAAYEPAGDEGGCRPCPVGYRKAAAGNTMCLCAPNYYNRTVAVAAAAAAAAAAATAPSEEGDGELQCSDPSGAHQYPPTPPVSAAGGECAQCPASCVSCAGGGDGAAEALPGFWAAGAGVYRCPNEAACPGGRQRACAAAYTGALCSSCASGHAARAGPAEGSLQGAECAQCRPASEDALVLAASALALALFAGFLVVSSSRPRSSTALQLRVLLNHVQTLALLGAFRRAEGTAALSASLSVLGRVTGGPSAYSSGCLLPAPTAPTLLNLLVAVLAAAALPLAVGMVCRRRKRKAAAGLPAGPRSPLLATAAAPVAAPSLYQRALLVLCFFLYPWVVQLVFQTLGPCVELGLGRRFLAADLRVPCDGALEAQRGVAWATLVLFVLGVPATTVWALLRRPALRSSGALQFLVTGYRPGRCTFLWEFVTLARKASISMSAALLVLRPSAQLTLGAGIINSALALHLLFAPFSGAGVNAMETTSLVVTNGTLLLASFIGEAGGGAAVALAVVAVAANAAFCTGAVWVVGSGMWRARIRAAREKDGGGAGEKVEGGGEPAATF